MSNPTGPDQPDEAAEAVTDSGHEPATEILLSPQAEAQLPAEETNQPAERRFTAPSGFDAGSTQIIDTPADPATEVMPVAAATAFTEPMAPQKPVSPQLIPPPTEPARPPRNPRISGAAAALLLAIPAV